MRQEFDIDPDKTGKSNEQKRQIAIIRYNSDRAIEAEEKRIGREMSEDEKVATIRKLAAATVVTERGWFGDTKKSILEISPDDKTISVRY